MRQVLDKVETAHSVNLAAVPRFNQSEVHGPKRTHPVADYFNPSKSMAMAKMDLDEIHA